MTTPPALDHTVPLDLAWRTMRDGEVSAVPIVNGDGTLFGMPLRGRHSELRYADHHAEPRRRRPALQPAQRPRGHARERAQLQGTGVSGELYIALPQNFADPALTSPDTILICGDQPDIIGRAIDAGVRCLIVCRANIRSEWKDAPENVCLISTPLSARRVSRIIYQALPVERIIEKKDVVAFHLSDYLDDVREIMLKSRYRSYPVLNAADKVVGTIGRFHLLRPRRKQVVLVDHNEAAQSVPALDQVEILEIIDHHRLADIQTTQPIRMRNEPVGSTNTILTAMYQERGIMPPPKIAGLMAGAILSDTVMFKSPTCTKRDIAMAERLARIAESS